MNADAVSTCASEDGVHMLKLNKIPFIVIYLYILLYGEVKKEEVKFNMALHDNSVFSLELKLSHKVNLFICCIRAQPNISVLAFTKYTVVYILNILLLY